MANYYTELSFVVRIGSEARAEWAKQIFDEFEGGMYPEYLDDPDWPDTGCLAKVETAKDPQVPAALWIRSDESAQINNLVSFLLVLVDTLQIDEPIGVEWASTCSKPRLDGFGGGAFVVKRGCEPRFMNSGLWLDQALEEINGESSASCVPESVDGPPTTP